MLGLFLCFLAPPRLRPSNDIGQGAAEVTAVCLTASAEEIAKSTTNSRIIFPFSVALGVLQKWDEIRPATISASHLADLSNILEQKPSWLWRKKAHGPEQIKLVLILSEAELAILAKNKQHVVHRKPKTTVQISTVCVQEISNNSKHLQYTKMSKHIPKSTIHVCLQRTQFCHGVVMNFAEKRHGSHRAPSRLRGQGGRDFHRVARDAYFGHQTVRTEKYG